MNEVDSEADGAGVINNGRGRRDTFLSSARRTSSGRVARPGELLGRATSDHDRRSSSRSLDNRPPLTSNLSSSMSVRANAVESGVHLFSVNSIAYIFLTAVNLSLIIAGITVLVRHWGGEGVCDSSFRRNWRWWALGVIVRKVLVTPAHMVRWKLSLQPPEERDPVLDRRSDSFVQFLEWVGFIYFVMGHVYLVQGRNCDGPLEWPIYELCVAMIVLKYMRYFFPCLLICVLGPAAICCLPCVIRVLALLQEPQQSEGPGQETLDTLPTVVYGEGMEGEDSCAICLVDYDAGDTLRKLPCDHIFHKTCTDNWLMVNPSCPICRARCFDDEGGGEGQGGATGSTPVGDNLA